MTNEEINNLAAEIHVLNKKWWPENVKDRSVSEILILIASEITECMEGERKDIMDDKLPHRKMAEVEMADTAIRALDVMGALKLEYTTGDATDNWCEFLHATSTKTDDLFTMICLVANSDRFNHEKVFISNVLWLVIEYCKKWGYDLWPAVREKLEYNKTRYDHSDEGRAAAGGKKW